ncbi:MlotiK1 channel [uncultured Clostridium sp.]|uniref:Ion transporter n=1 Tax=Muricoprocola aceti TaxID=2981772 RepID=A0ABT2SL46_9FIRM|nr:ion transporter [Muricoprocola aceti]MCU6725015.1 ion transporter [Muricoprocola aceti]SCH35814.1 MlotiK1 channel [uncultured Clostridium sp.]
MKPEWEKRRRRLYELIEIGCNYDVACWGYDVLNTFTIILNLTVSILYTFDNWALKYGSLLLTIERLTVAFFAVDFLMRVITAKCLYPNESELGAVRKYLLSFSGIVDMLSFIPYYLPVFFPSGAVAFRMLRIIRIFRLFRINAYYDSLNVITEVIISKKQQLMSSVFIILVLMISSSLCMYSLENKAQPEVFTNAFSGIWWAASTLLTVGYGDIYPVTTMGKIFGIFIAFLGVGMVAIPTGIISAGFVDQYSRIKRMSEYGKEEDIHFIRIPLTSQDGWCGRKIRDLHLPKHIIIAVVQSNKNVLIPNGDLELKAGDVLVIGAESVPDSERITLKEVTLEKRHSWTGHRICDLDISRHSVIVLVKRHGKALIPYGTMLLQEGDTVILYTQTYLANSEELQI